MALILRFSNGQAGNIRMDQLKVNIVGKPEVVERQFAIPRALRRAADTIVELRLEKPVQYLAPVSTGAHSLFSDATKVFVQKKFDGGVRMPGLSIGRYDSGWDKLFDPLIEGIKTFDQFLLVTDGDTSILKRQAPVEKIHAVT